MPRRHHNSYSTLNSWKTVSDPAGITVIPSSRDGIRSLLITIVGGVGMYWLANHLVTIEDASGLAMWNAIVLGTPLLMAVFILIHRAMRDKRPYLVVNLQDMEVSLPRLEIRFPVGDPSYTFVHDFFSVRGDDDVSEFNLIRHIGPHEISHPILRTLGKNASFFKLGQTLQFAGLRFAERKADG